MTTDDELARAALDRALADHLRSNPHAPIEIGKTNTVLGQTAVALVMRRACRCGAPLGQAVFLGSGLESALREATRFVRALIPPDEE